MIDYVKLKIVDVDLDLLLNKPQLEFLRPVNESTGELGNKTICTIFHCKIIAYDSGTVIFSGSIHKLYNSISGIDSPNLHNKGYNGNQFGLYEIQYVKHYLMDIFEVLPKQMIFQNIEFGLNLTTSFDPQQFIEGLLLFEKAPFEFRYRNFYAQSVHFQYIIKIYNKGHQYQLPLNTLRFEIKVLKMFHQKEVGIWSMQDITTEKILKALAYLKKQLIKTLYYDNTINEKKLNKKQKIKLKDYNNSKYWQNLNRQQRSKHKKLLHRIIHSYSRNLKNELLLLIDDKRIQFDQHFKQSKYVRFDHSNIESKCIQNLQ